MSYYSPIHTQNELLLKSLMEFYKEKENIDKMMKIVNGKTKISLRIVDWFVTNFAKKYYTVYSVPSKNNLTEEDAIRFKVYNEYKLKLKSYKKQRFDPFCRWERITIPYEENMYVETTIGQLNFFKWAIENLIIEYIEENYDIIEKDMDSRNSLSRRNLSMKNLEDTTTENFEDTEKEGSDTKTRKKRQELSVFASKCIKKETVKIVVKFT
jgi:hypothetical protein